MKKLFILFTCLFVIVLSGCMHIYHGERRPAYPPSRSIDRHPAPPHNRYDTYRHKSPGQNHNTQVRPAPPPPRR